MKQEVVATIFSGKLYCRLDDFHKAMEELLGRPVYTHEFANEKVWEQAREHMAEIYIQNLIESELGEKV